MNAWHNDGSNVSTLENKTLNIYHILEDLNCGIENIRRALEQYTQSPHRLPEELCESKDAIHRQIKTLGKSYRRFRSNLFNFKKIMTKVICLL